MQAEAMADPGLPFTIACDSAQRDVWLAARLDGIGASESSAIIGASPWMSALELWAIKTRQVPETSLDEVEAVFWGSELEQAIVSGFSKRTGRAAVPFGLMLRSTRWPWLTATPDALTTDDPDAAKRLMRITLALKRMRMHLHRGDLDAGLIAQLIECTQGWWPLQIKNIGFGSAEHWADGVPLYYRIQCVHEALVFGAKRCTGAALVAGQRLAWDDVDVEPVLERQIVNLTEAFWDDSVKGGISPDPDGSDSAKRAIAALWPLERPESVAHLSYDDMQLSHRRLALKAEIKEREAEILLLENQLKMSIADNERVIFPDGSGYTYKQVTRREHLVPAHTYRDLRHKTDASEKRKGKKK